MEDNLNMEDDLIFFPKMEDYLKMFLNGRRLQFFLKEMEDYLKPFLNGRRPQLLLLVEEGLKK